LLTPPVRSAPKTVNNVLTVLSTLLKKAVEWGELERLLCVVKLLPNPQKTMGFHDFDAERRAVTPAPDDAATDGGTEGRASSARRAGVVLGGWIADHP
jgi:hypothetical protein